MYKEKPELYKQELSSKQTCALLFQNQSQLSNLEYVDVSGGEPFLKKDLKSVLRCIHQISPKVRIAIATNGLEPDQIVKTVTDIVQEVPLYAIRVSVDGMKKTHDTLRGINGAFDRTIKTVKELSTLGEAHGFSTGIGFTITPSNYEELFEVFKLSNELGVSFLCRSVHVGHTFFNIDQSYRFSPEAIKEIAKTLDNIAKVRKSEFGRGWLSSKLEQKLISFYFAGIKAYLKNPSHMFVPCFAGRAAFVLDPYGYVFPCLLIKQEMGNIRNCRLADFWVSEKSKSIAKRIEKGLCPNCWMDCSLSNIKADLVQITKWVLKSSITGKDSVI